MQRKTNHWKQLSGAKIVRVNPTRVPFIPGIGLILLGAIIFLAPKFFLAAIGTFFVLLGIGACYIAWKFMAFKRQVSKLAEEFQNSVDVRSFQVQNSDDIDITETDSKKIYYH
jgi:Flp pilus assembly protein TadB